jgi:hypothetical protein
VLPQQLATSPAWRDVGVIANTCNRNDASAAAHMERTQDCALSAQGESVRRIFYIATRDDATIINKCCRTYSKF